MAIKVFIDQGHNPSGANTGAEGIGINESEVTYEVGRYLYNLLNENPNYEARLSRNTPSEVIGSSNLSSLSQRVNEANRWDADVFVSIHTNAFPDPAANGTEVLVYRRGGIAYTLGEEILRRIVENLGMRDRGVKIRPSIYVLRKTRMPAVLVELGFITNPSDAAKLRNNPYGFAFAIYQGITGYF